MLSAIAYSHAVASFTCWNVTSFALSTIVNTPSTHLNTAISVTMHVTVPFEVNGKVQTSMILCFPFAVCSIAIITFDPDAAKSIALAPADAIAATLEASGKGAVRVGQQGAVDTVGAFGSAGAAVGHVLVDGSDSGGSTGRIGGGAIVGFFAGVLVGVPFAPVGAVAGGLVGAVSGLMHSYTCPSGGWKVSGWTEDHIKCGRLGFVEAQGGKVTNTEFSSKLFRDSGFKKLQMEKTNDPKDIVAEHHCKNMTSFNFDVRHMAECLKHTKLCGHKGGYVAPRTGKDVCVKASGKKKQDLVNDMIGAMFTDTDLE